MIYVCIARKFFHLQLEGLCTNMSSQTRKHMGGVLKKVASFTPSKTSRQVLLATKKHEFFCLLALSHPPQRKGKPDECGLL